MKKAGVQQKIETLVRPREFKMAAGLPDSKPATLKCNKVINVDTELHISYGFALTLRVVRWLFTDQAVD